jgi:hypothetical protein
VDGGGATGLAFFAAAASLDATLTKPDSAIATTRKTVVLLTGLAF